MTIRLGARTDGKKNSVDSVWAMNHRHQNNVDAYGQCTVVCVIILDTKGLRSKTFEVFFSRELVQYDKAVVIFGSTAP